MVAIVTSNTLGLNLSSMSALGAGGVLGSATQGRNGEFAAVNAATGNLVLQDRDGLLVGVGRDVVSLRTYNSQGLANGSNNDGWLLGLNKTVTRVNATTLQRTDGDGSVSTFVYNATSQLYVQTATDGTPAGSIKVNADNSFTWTDGSSGSHETYAAATGQIASATDPIGNTQTYTYTGGLLTKVTDANGEYVTFGYGGASGKNLLTQTTTLQGGQTVNQVSYGYDTLNRLSTVSVLLNQSGTVPAGADTLASYVTTYGYDGSSTRVTSVTQSDKTALTIGYVLVGGAYKVASVMDGDGNTTTYGYNTATNTTTVTDPLGVSSVYRYDASGNLTQVRTGVTASNTGGQAQLSYGYNALGEVTSVIDGLGNTVTLQYDANGNQTSHVDAAGDTVVSTYNASNQLLTETAYSVAANATTGAAASGAMTTRYVYAAANATQLRYAISPEGAVTEYRYNALGLRTAAISYADANYAVGSLASTAVPTEAQMQSWAAARDLTQSQRTDFAYDFRGQLQSTTAYGSVDSTGAGVAASASTTQYVRDLQGQLLQTISPDARTISQYIYDGLGRVVSTLVKSSDATLSSLTLAQYDDANGKTTVTQANGLSTTSTYDGAGRLTSVVQSQSGTTLGTTQYAYDADGRLLMTTDQTGQHTWMLYDAAGRKVADIDGAGDLTEFVYNADNQVTQTIRYSTPVAVAQLVDAQGRPTTGYNGNPTAAPQGATVVTLAGIRPAATAQDVKNWNLYDSAGRLALQVNGVGDATLTQYDGASRVIAVTQLATQVNTATLGNGVGVSLPAIALPASTTSLTNTVSGATHTLTATVGSTIAANHPSGAITFYEVTAGGPVSLGSAMLVNGVAVLNTTRLPAGTLAYAVYSGDASNPASTSAQVGDAAAAATVSTTTLSAGAAAQAGASVTLTATITGATPSGNVVFYRSGVAIGVAAVNASGVAALQVDNLPVGANSITAVYQGDAHNTVSTASAVTQTITQATSTTALTLSTAQAGNRSASGAPVVLTARIAGANATGNVSFYSGTTLLGTASAVNGIASLSVSTLAVGADSLTAQYAGDANNTASTSAAAVQTVLAGTTTALAVSSTSSALGAPVLLTATVSGSTPGGTVSFFNGTTLIGSASVSAGVATFVYTPSALGVAGLQAVYSGDATNATSASTTVNDTVATAPTVTTLASSGVQSVQGSAVTLTATVVNTTGAPLVAGSTVTFYNGSTAIGTGTLAVTGSTGIATLSLSTLPTGADSLKAVYAGDASNAGSTSGVLVQNVSALATSTLALTTSAASAAVGGSVTLTATVTASTAATGTVTFYNGSTVLGTAAIASGKAALTLSSLPGGTDNISASYAGDATHAGSVAPAITETIAPLATTTVVTSTAPTTTLGAAVILSAKVTGTAAAQATGSISFYSGTTTTHTLLGTATVVNGVAALTLSSLPTTTTTVYAVYAGDASNAASTSATAAQTVSTAPPAATTSTLSATPASVALGASVTLTAHVTGAAPSGLVTFFNGQTPLGTATVSGGVATLVTTRLPTGAATLTATYAGDAANATSVSSAATVTVSATGTAPTAPTLTASTATLALSSATSVRGAALTLTATVAAGTAKPTGTVAFFVGTTLVGSATINATTGQAVLVLNTPASLAVGVNSIKAVYSGDATYATSASAAAAETVSLATTTATLALPASSATAGTVPLVAQIKGSSPSVLPTGTVTFYNGSTALGTATIVNGLATLSASLPAGTASLKVTYGGDANNAASTSAVGTLNVNAALATSATSLASSTSASAAGAAVTLTATVTGASPTGTVSFFNGTTLLGSAVVASGVATLSTTTLAGGAHALTAVYSGDAANQASTSGSATDTVALAATTATLTTSTTTAVSGSAVVLTARVANTVGQNAPTGTVTFYNGATVLGTSTLAGGLATLSLTNLPQGLDGLRVTYAGDGNNAASSSATFAEGVVAAASTLARTSATSIATNGALTISVTGASPTGVVTLLNGKTVLGTATVTAGVATFSPANLPVGSSTLTVSYSGDANNAASVASFAQTATTATTTSTLSVAPVNYQAQSAPVVLTASVAGSNPTGTVSFYDGATLLGQGTLSNGLAAITTSSLSAGAHSLTAKYAGDANNAASTSGAVADNVVAAPVNVSVSSSSGSQAQGTPLTLTATVKGNAPSGIVTFIGNNNVGLGVAAVVNGVATLVVSKLGLPAGNSIITAIYSGDANNPSAASTNLAQTVTAPATVVTPVQTANDRTTSTVYNNDGQLRATIDGEGYLVEYRYDTAGRLVQTVKYANVVPGFTGSASIATAVATARSSDSLASLLPATSTDDINTYAFYDNAGRVIGQVDGAGYLTETVYTADGQVAKTIRYANPAAGTVSVHATLSTLRPASSPEDHVTSTTWDALGRMATQTNAEGTLTQYTYDVMGNVTSAATAVSTSDLRTLQTQFDVQGRVTASLSADGAALLTGGQTAAQVAAIWAQYATTYQYDAAGRKISSVDPMGNRTLFHYDAAGRLAYQVDAAGDITQYQYDGVGHLESTTQIATVLTAAQLATLTGGVLTAASQAVFTSAQAAATAKNVTNSATFDAAGEQVTATDGLSQTTTQTYNAFGQAWVQTKTISGQTLTTTQAYDHRGLQTSAVQASGALSATVTRQYDAFGRLINAKDANLNTSSWAYDRLGRVVTTTDNLRVASTTTYDAFDRVLTQSDAYGQATSYIYNTASRSVVIKSPLGVTLSTTVHTREGQTFSVTDGNGNTTSYLYDADGNLTKTTSPLNSVSNAYDADDRLTQVTDADNHVTSIAYDAASRVYTETVDPSGLALKTTYAYDAMGRRVTVTDPDGIVTQFAYDLDGQVLQKTVDPTGLKLVTQYSYDSAGHTLTVTSPGNVVTKYVYDGLGRRVQQITDPSGLNLVQSYTYDLDGNVVTATDPAGALTRYAYDADNRQIYAVDALGGVAYTLYDNDGRVSQTIRYAKPIAVSGTAAMSAAAIKALVVATPGTDVVQGNYYDRDGHLTYTVDGMGDVVHLAYDANGNVTDRIAYATRVTPATWSTPPALGAAPAVTTAPAQDHEVRTVFDALNRPTWVLASTANGMWSVTANVYDGKGNLTSVTHYATAIPAATAATAAAIASAAATVANAAVDVTLRYAYDNADRRTWSVDGTGAVTQTVYDADGNVVKQVAYATRIAATAAPSSVATSTADRVNLMAYDKAGRLVYAQDALGNVTQTTYAYSTTGSTITSVAYATPTAAPTAASAVRSAATFASAVVTNAADRKSVSLLDAAGRQVFQVSANGAVVKTVYDADGRAVATVAYATPLAAATLGSLAANASSTALATLVTTNSALDRTSLFAYDAAGNLTYSVDPMGYVTKDTVDAFGRVTQTQLYTSSGLAVGATAATIAGAISAATYTGRTTSTAYDAAGNVLRITDALGLQQNYTYDGVGNKLSYTNQNNATWNYTYDAAGRVLSETGPAVNVTTVSVDANGVITKGATTSQRIVTQMTYDALGNLSSRTEAAGTGSARTTSYQYDRAGHQVKTTYPPVGVYNASDLANLASDAYTAAARTDTLSTLSTQVVYDAFGDAVANIDVAGNISTKTYDSDGRVAFEVDAMGYITGYQRNAFGDVLTLTRYATAVTSLNAGVTAAGAGVPSTATVQTALVTNAADRAITTQYDALGRAVQVTQPSTWVNNGKGQAYNAAAVTRTVYDAFGDVVQTAQLADAPTSTWAWTTSYFDADGRQVASVDPMGYLTTQAFDPAGNLIGQTQYTNAVSGWNPLAPPATAALIPTPTSASTDRTVTFKYDNDNRKQSQTLVNVSYSATGGAANVVGNLTTSYGYDAVGNLTSTTDAKNNTTYTYYDAMGRTMAVAAPTRASTAGSAALTPLTVFLRDAFGNVVVQTQYANTTSANASTYSVPTASALDRTTLTQFDSHGNALETQDALGFAHYMSYTAQGQLAKSWMAVTAIDSSTRTLYTAFQYDALGRQTAIITPASDSVLSGGAITLQSQASVGSNKTAMVYNAFGEMTQRGTFASSATPVYQESFSYDNAGHLWKTNTGSGLYTVTVYDLLGHTTAQITSDGLAEAQNLDLSAVASAQAADQLTSGVRRTDFRLDLLGHVLTQTLPLRQDSTDTTPYRPTVVQTFDRWGNMLSQSDVRNSALVTTYLYDNNNHVIQKTQPDVANGAIDASSPVTQIYYDALGEQVAVRDANGNVNTQVFDGAGQIYQEVHADGGVITHLYDAFGQQVQQTDADGFVTTYAYDQLGRETKVTNVGAGVYTVSASNVVSAAASADVTTTYTYDQAGRKTSQYDAAGETTSLTNDLLGNVVASTDAMGRVTRYTYNAQGKQTAEVDQNSKLSTWSYDYFGQLTAHADIGGATYSFNYDNARQLTSQTNTRGQNLAYTYDAAGQMVKEVDAYNSETTYYAYNQAGQHILEETVKAGTTIQNQVLGYDKLGRLQTVDDAIAGLHQLVSYDKMGNRMHLHTAYVALLPSVVTDYGPVPVLDENGNPIYDAVQTGTQQVPETDESGNIVYQDVQTGTQQVQTGTQQVQTGTQQVQTGTQQVQTGTQQVQTGTQQVQTGTQQVQTGTKQVQTGTQQVQATDESGNPLFTNGTTVVGYDESGNPIYNQVPVMVTVPVYSTVPVYATVPVYTTVPVYSTVPVYTTVPVYSTVPVYTTVPVYSTVPVYTKEPVMITVPVYTQVERMTTGVIGHHTVYSTSAHTSDLYFAYDNMNREVLADGAVDSNVLNTANVVSGQGHILSYDKNGNRVEDQSWGTQVTPHYVYDESSNSPILTGYTSQAGMQIEWYSYDSANRLQTVSTGGFDAVQTGVDGSGNPIYTTVNLGKSHAIVLDNRYYDAASRVVESGPGGPGNPPASALPSAYITALVGSNSDLSGATSTISQYDKTGRVQSQVVTNLADSKQSSTTSFAGGYDGAGNLQHYTTTSNGITTVTNVTQLYYDGYLQGTTSSTSTNNSSGHTTTGSSTDNYDANGFLTSVSSVVNGAEDTASERTMVNDAGGHVLTKTQQGNTLNESVVNGTVVGIYGYGTDPAKPLKSDGTPNYQVQGNFDLAYTPVTNSYPAAATGQYAVRAGDTLQSIAQSAYGDSSLWYQVADANGLSGNQDLRVGSVLNLPTRVGSVHNDSSTYAPYDPGKIVGSTNPNLPTPAGNSKHGSGGIGTIVMIVVAVVATVFTAGAASIFLAGGMEALGAASLGEIAAAGAAALTGTAAVGVSVATSTGLAALGAAAVGGAVGSIVSQGIGDAIGASSGFSWKQVALGAVGSAVGAGVGEVAPGLAAAAQGVGPTSWAAAAASAAIGNATTQEVSIGLGLQKQFSWRQVAGAAAGAAIGSAASQGLSTTNELAGPTLDGSPLLARGSSIFGDNIPGNLARATASGMAGGLTAAEIVGHGRVQLGHVAADAFGNALGNSIVDRLQQPPTVAEQMNRTTQALSAIDDLAAKYGGLDNVPTSELRGFISQGQSNSKTLASTLDTQFGDLGSAVGFVGSTGHGASATPANGSTSDAAAAPGPATPAAPDGEPITLQTVVVTGHTDPLYTAAKWTSVAAGVVAGEFQNIGDSLIGLGSLVKNGLLAQQYIMGGGDNAFNRALNPFFDAEKEAFGNVVGTARAVGEIVQHPLDFASTALEKTFAGVQNALDTASDSGNFGDWFLYGAAVGNATMGIATAIGGVAGAARLVGKLGSLAASMGEKGLVKLLSTNDFGGAPRGPGGVVTRAAYEPPANPAKVFVSKDPLVGEIATALEHELPGTVDGIEKPIASKLHSSDADIQLRSGDMIEVKSGPGTGLEDQLAKQSEIIGPKHEVIVYAPELGGTLEGKLVQQGYNVFRNMNDLLDYLKTK